MRNTLRSIRNALGSGYAAPQKYWERRYRRLGGSVTAPGCIDIDAAGNEEDYDVKWREILEAVQAAGIAKPIRALDAGCGSGVLTERMVAAGWSVTAVDFSPSALEAARRRVTGPVNWQCAPIESLHSDAPFDLVVNVDVLHHVVDADAFRTTLRRLCSLVARDGVLIINTHLATEERSSGGPSHVRFRTRAEFAEALPPGWVITSHRDYHLPREGASKDLLTIRHA